MKLCTTVSILSTAALVVADGCGTLDNNFPIGQTSHHEFSDGDREFLVHVPASYNPSVPTELYFSFHGAGKNSSEQEGLSGLSDPYFNPTGIAVYPQGKDGYWLSHPGIDPNDRPNDIDFTISMIDFLEEKLCIDKTRIYATGKSNGGGLTNLLACNSTTAARIAAFAGVSGAYYEDDLAQNCAPGRPVPFISFHGWNDSTIPYGGKVGSSPDTSTYPIDQWLADWRKRDGIPASESPRVNTTIPLVTKLTWCEGGYGPLIRHYNESNLGHVWPSTLPNDDCPKPSTPKCPMGHYTYNATTEIVNYFKKWHL